MEQSDNSLESDPMPTTCVTQGMWLNSLPLSSSLENSDKNNYLRQGNG